MFSNHDHSLLLKWLVAERFHLTTPSLLRDVFIPIALLVESLLAIRVDSHRNYLSTCLLVHQLLQLN